MTPLRDFLARCGADIPDQISLCVTAGEIRELLAEIDALKNWNERLQTFKSLVESEQALAYWENGEIFYTKPQSSKHIELIARPVTGVYRIGI